MTFWRAMKITYELNPPRIVRGDEFDPRNLRNDIQIMVDRACQLEGRVSGIHLTDSVLGIPRLSSITAASSVLSALGRNSPALSCSLRSRDRNFTSLSQAVGDATILGVESLLILLGDEPADGPGGSYLKPSEALAMLKRMGYNKWIGLNLSFPARVKDCPPRSVEKKIEARPDCFVTQSISSLSDLGEIVDLARPHGIRTAAVIMVPSEKNRQSASAIGLDWSGYEKDPVEFIKSAGRIADGVILTSPNSFRAGLEILDLLK